MEFSVYLAISSFSNKLKFFFIKKLIRIFFLFKNEDYKNAIIDYINVIFCVVKGIKQLRLSDSEAKAI